jgi:hypothetical protein
MATLNPFLVEATGSLIAGVGALLVGLASLIRSLRRR